MLQTISKQSAVVLQTINGDAANGHGDAARSK
jgi:hypothetical protein